MESNNSFYLTLCFILIVCGCRNKTDSNYVTTENASQIVKDNTAFAMDLYKQLSLEEGNLFFSPYSISVCLANVYAGARGNTEKQIAKALHFTQDQNDLHPAFAALQEGLNKMQQKGDVKLNIANSLWPQKDYPFLKEYLSITKKYYSSSITPVDYVGATGVAVETINNWVEEKTEGKIKNIISDLSSDTRMVLANAIYFKGNWEHEFNPSSTKDSPFYITSEKFIQMPIMVKTMKTMYAETSELQILELPYIGEDISMLILLPKEIDELGQLEDRLSIKNLDSWRNKLKQEEVLIYLPKFKMTCNYCLIPCFQDMGMTDAFYHANADLSGMTGTNDLYIDSIIHEAFVEVNEEGTEATAATAVGAAGAERVSQPEIFTFRADHPFIFIIQEKKTGSILFIGRLSEPGQTID